MANRSSSHPGVNMKERSGWPLSRAKVQDLSVPNRLIDSPVLSNLSLERLFGVEARAHIRHPEGSILFGEGQRALGVYIIWDGRIKVSIGSDNGKALILGLFGRGTVLGLPAALLGRPYGATAEVMKPANVTFLSRGDFLRQLRATDRAGYAVAEIVSSMSYSVLAGIRIIHLSQSAEQKMARFLLRLRPMHKSSKGELHVMLESSQEEIGQMIGASRETVARVISRLKKRGILDLKAPMLVIHDVSALARLAECQPGPEHNMAEGVGSRSIGKAPSFLAG